MKKQQLDEVIICHEKYGIHQSKMPKVVKVDAKMVKNCQFWAANNHIDDIQEKHFSLRQGWEMLIC